MALRDDVLKFYPQLAWALDIPDVARVLEQAVINQWDAARLQAGLQGTDWWKNTVPSAREWQEKMAKDPQSINQSLRQLEAKLQDMSQQAGVNLPPGFVVDLARQAMQFGWNDNQMRDTLISWQTAQPNKPSDLVGDIGSNMAKLRQQASSYMVTVDDRTAWTWAKQIAAGEKKPEDFNVVFQDWSKSKFPTLSKLIDQGYTPEQYFAPYKQEMAKLLEVNADGIDMDLPQYNPIINYVDPQAGTPRPMTISEAQKFIRSTPEWRKTQNGQAAGARIAASLQKVFTGQ